MSKQHEEWRFNIATEIAELLAARGCTVDDAVAILRRLQFHADDHTGFTPFRTKLTCSDLRSQTSSCETQASAPVDRASSAKATKRLPAKRKVLNP